ncbi:MAG: hypothetical protein M5U26_30525 [Planctomycetota bacterium]|nr:hypothetical protein [Planctomycetota bacterium]
MRRNKATEAVRWALALAACCAGAGELRAADLKPALEKKLAEVLQEPVAIGAYRLGLDPPLAVLENLRIGEAVPETGGHPLAEVERLTVEYIPSALLLGGTFFKSMEFSGAHFYVGADRRGHSNFQAFLEKLLARREKEADLPGLGDLNFRGVALTFYAPKDLTAPRGELAPDPVTVRLAALSLRNLSAPQPKRSRARAGARSVDQARLRRAGRGRAHRGARARQRADRARGGAPRGPARRAR